MWTRAQLKQKGKFAFQRNYWKTVLISLILTALLGGSSAAGSISSSVSSVLPAKETYVTTGSYTYHDTYEEFDDVFGEFDEEIYDDTLDQELLDDGMDTVMVVAVLTFLIVFLIVFIVIMAVALLLDAFLFCPLEVGCRRYFLMNLNNQAEVKEMAYGFDHNYKNIVKTMFLRDIFTILWSLLFIIPGIVKSYEYRMIPYLLAENPQMTKNEAFAISKQMMTGQKWKAFVLDLSFLGWEILSIFTFGLLDIFYVGPYRNMTWAALYEALKNQNRSQDYGQNPYVTAQE